jgi:hypothetical protein
VVFVNVLLSSDRFLCSINGYKSLFPMRPKVSLSDDQIFSDMTLAKSKFCETSPRPADWKFRADKKCSAATSYV